MSQPTFQKARLGLMRPLNESLLEVILETAGSRLEGALEHPGQFVQLRVPTIEKPLFLAVASPPAHADRLEFLLRRDGGVSEVLLGMPFGSELECTAPMGPGFPIDDHEGADLLLFAGGSGISALRPVLLHATERRARYGEIHLYFGVRRPGDFAYAAEFQSWESAGIHLHPVVSQPGGDAWDGPVGHVQELFAANPFPLENAVALLCGVKGMHESVTELLQSAGLPPGRILCNY